VFLFKINNKGARTTILVFLFKINNKRVRTTILVFLFKINNKGGEDHDISVPL